MKYTREALKTKYGGSSSSLANGYQKITLQITPDQPKYQWQSITVENRTLKLRWPVDVPYNGSRPLTGIIAGPDDELYVMVNRATYAVVALFGFGIGVYDLDGAAEEYDKARYYYDVGTPRPGTLLSPYQPPDTPPPVLTPARRRW